MEQCPISAGASAAKLDVSQVYRRLKPDAGISLADKATAFLDLLVQESDGPGVSAVRRQEVLRDIQRFGFYEHSPEELLWGCRFAWRHSVRCIGRFFWRQLEVRDARSCGTVEEVAQACVDHISSATNAGSIRSLVTVFAPEHRARHFRIANRQLVRYAGYRGGDGEILGDPGEVELTELCLRNGWAPPGGKGPFDVLPLLVFDSENRCLVREVPRDVLLEVPLVHPEFAWFRELHLRWYAVPIVSDMLLEIGGIRYPAAPFNGWYMGTEIGARNLADRGRYDLLPVIADKMGILDSRERSLWRDRALLELNRAVLFSYGEAGVRIIDHHTAGQLHVSFEEEERALGRPVTGRWDWLVPPLSGATSPIWVRSYDPTEYSPNFYYQPARVFSE
ncbi:MAG: nitric oxide synthase oxygenase [Verrucomicrobiota bacterium]